MLLGHKVGIMTFFSYVYVLFCYYFNFCFIVFVFDVFALFCCCLFFFLSSTGTVLSI